MPRAKPGQRFGGRAQGVPNKSTAVWEAIRQAAARPDGKEDLVAFLTQLADDDPRTFAKLLLKLLPKPSSVARHPPLPGREI